MKNKISICFLLFTTIFVLIHANNGNTKKETNNSEAKLKSTKVRSLIPTHKKVKKSQPNVSAKIKPEEQIRQTEIENKSDSKSNTGVGMLELKRVLSADMLSYIAKAGISSGYQKHSEKFWSELDVDKNASVELIEIMTNNLKSGQEQSSDNKMLIQKPTKTFEEDYRLLTNKDLNNLFIENLKKFIKDEQEIEMKKEKLEKIKNDLENRAETKIEKMKILIEKFNKLKITKNKEVEEANKLAENEWNELKNKIIYRMEEKSVEIYENFRDEIINKIYKYSDLQSEKGKKINSLNNFYKGSKSQLETEKQNLDKYLLTIKEKENLEKIMKEERNFTEIISKAQKIVKIKPTRKQKQKEGKMEENKEENNNEDGTKIDKMKKSLINIARTKSLENLTKMAKEIKNKTKNETELEIKKLLKNYPLINEMKPILNQIRNKAAIIYLIYKLEEIKNVENDEKNVKIFTKEFLEKIERKALEQMEIFNGGQKEEFTEARPEALFNGMF
uniref:Uncharacterized protein n=1 Tax=Meloidogyne floridensis TaxID=298350 RepID=A0A915NUZ3_9BILA